MSVKLAKKVKDNQEIAERNILDTVKQISTNDELITAAMMLGAVKAVNHINAYFAAQTIRGLQRLRDEKYFEHFGFTRFDDFLDEHKDSPMSYKQFYDREKLLLNEGDEMFDILNSLKFSIRRRRLLGAGNVTVEDGKMIIKRTGDDGSEYIEEIEINDHQKLIQTLSAVADQAAQLQEKSDKYKIRLERRDNDIADLTEKIQRGETAPKSAYFEKYVIARAALAQLGEHIENEVTPVEKERTGEIYLRELFAEFAKIRQSLGRGDLRFDAPATADNEFSEITSKMNEDELAAMMD